MILFFFSPNLRDGGKRKHGESQLSVLLLDPEHQQAQSVDLTPIHEELQQTHQTDPPVETLEQWTNVRKDHAERCGFILIIDEENHVRIQEFHYVLLNVPHLLIAQGNETPVTRPGGIIYLPDQSKLRVCILWTREPDVNTSFLGDPFSKTIHPLGKPVIAIYQESQQVLFFGEAVRFDQLWVVRRVVGHHQGRRIIESLNEQPHLVIAGRVERASHEGHPLLVNPRLHGRKEGCRGLRIVSAFEKSPNAHLFVVELVIMTIYDARNPSHRLRTTSGQKEDAFGKLPERVSAGIQQPVNLLLKGGNPVGVSALDPPW